ncbi:PoNe immunity protein domain-containing protein [Undibacterium sp. TJN25]|uniref:PoNe immunity protein domain-containing protein n=1 Tax=Undibacterium sp. TJN25 TaxID=3413056 RepID=UPI003BF1E9D7
MEFKINPHIFDDRGLSIFERWFIQKQQDVILKESDKEKQKNKINPNDFNESRRQKMLIENLYEKTSINQQALLAVAAENLKIAISGTESHSSNYAMLYLEAFWSWTLDYTAGKLIEELAPRIAGIVDAFEAWNEADQLWLKAARERYPEDGPYEYRGAPDFSTLADYEDTLQLLSAAILVRDERSVMRIIHVLRSHRNQDSLFECLASAYTDVEEIPDNCILGKPFDILSELFFAETADESEALLEKYLKKWYPAMKDHPRWYDGHLNIIKEGHAPYYGYWAFEAGAAVYLLDLDDSLIDHLVYPKDLVAYGKMLREQDRYTSKNPEEVSEIGRVQGGQACPAEGYWETPARANSRHFFKQGEVMPTFEGANYGATIWQRSVDQSPVG